MPIGITGGLPHAYRTWLTLLILPGVGGSRKGRSSSLSPHLSSPLATPCLSSVFMPFLTHPLLLFFPLSGLITPLLSLSFSLCCSVFSGACFLVAARHLLLCTPLTLSLGASLLTPQGQRCFPPLLPPLPMSLLTPPHLLSCPQLVSTTPFRHFPRPLEEADPHARPQVTLSLYILRHSTCLTFTYLPRTR